MTEAYDPEPFEQLLHKLIEASGESYRQIAHSVGLNASSVTKYLKGQRPSQTACIALAVRFGISPNEMLRAAGYEPLPHLERRQSGDIALDDEIQKVAAKLQHVWNWYDGGVVLNAFGALVDAYLKARRNPPRQMLQYVPAGQDLLDQVALLDGRVFWEGNTGLLIPTMHLWPRADLAQWPAVDQIQGCDLFAAPSGTTLLHYELPVSPNDYVSDVDQSLDEIKRSVEAIWAAPEGRDSLSTLGEMVFLQTHPVADWRERWGRFFGQEVAGVSLLDTLAWFLFQTYDQPRDAVTLAQCPLCDAASVQLDRGGMNEQGQFSCPECGGTLYLSDVFGLHQSVGANPVRLVQGQMRAIKQLLLIHGLRLMLTADPAQLDRTLFVQQGPLAFLEYPEPCSLPMEALAQFLFAHHHFYWIGFELEGAPMYYARQIADRLEPGSILILNNEDWQDAVPTEYASQPHIDRVAFKLGRDALFVFTLPAASINLFADQVILDHLRVILSVLDALSWDGKEQPAWASEELARLMGLLVG